MTEAVDTVVHGNLVKPHTGTIEEGAVAIDDGEIVALADRPSDRDIETGAITPGLIDAHMHVESGMVTLPRYGEAVVPRGVTSIVTDPHEIANVVGEAGVRAHIRDATHTPLKARFTVPSSVPATDLQDGGAVLGPEAVERLLDGEKVVALGEVMNIPGLLAGDQSVHAKIQATRRRELTVDGHMPRVTGPDLQEAVRYLDTDHESITLEEAREKVHAGLRVYLRQGSSSKNLDDLAPLVDEVETRRLSLCTDDRDVVDLVEFGGVDYAVQLAIEAGIDPVTAIQMATLNTAEAYDLPFGRLEPGAPADLVLLSDLDTWAVEHVMIDGVLDPTTKTEEPPATEIQTDTVHFAHVEPVDLAHPVSSESNATHRVRVIDAIGGLQTEAIEGRVPSEDGHLIANIDSDLLPLAVIERHGNGGGIGTGFVHRLGLERGAIGSTIAHDAHNLVVAGVEHDSMARVANHLRDIGGGVAAYDPNTETMTSLALPVAGLMTDRPLENASEQFRAVEETADRIGLSHEGGLMELSFLPLEVIPEIRLTNNGLVDVTAMEYVDVVLA